MQRPIHVALALAVVIATLVQGGAARSADSPLSSTAYTAAFEGRRLWLKENCYGCHGAHAGGGIAANIQRLGQVVPYAVGGGFAGSGMPNFTGTLGSTDIANLSAYVNVAGTPSEPTFLQWWAKTPQN